MNDSDISRATLRSPNSERSEGTTDRKRLSRRGRRPGFSLTSGVHYSVLGVSFLKASPPSCEPPVSESGRISLRVDFRVRVNLDVSGSSFIAP